LARTTFQEAFSAADIVLASTEDLLPLHPNETNEGLLARIPGAGDVQIFGSGDYAMRVWLNPDKAAARNLTANDIVNAIREQNVQVAAGAIGQQPVSSPLNFELQINAKGRLISTEEFEQIIVKTGHDGEKIRLKDVARVELSAGSYALRSLLNNKTAVALPIFQTPGANALQLSTDVRAKMEELKKEFLISAEKSALKSTSTPQENTNQRKSLYGFYSCYYHYLFILVITSFGIIQSRSIAIFIS